MIDWKNEDSMVSRHFSVKECLWLPRWGRLANEDDGLTEDIKCSLIQSFTVFDEVRDFLNCKVNVHSGYRPPSYNKLIGGNTGDPHERGLALDCDLESMSIQDAKDLLEPMLDHFKIRMENNGRNADWLHLDCSAVKFKRFFLP